MKSALFEWREALRRRVCSSGFRRFGLRKGETPNVKALAALTAIISLLSVPDSGAQTRAIDEPKPAPEVKLHGPMQGLYWMSGFGARGDDEAFLENIDQVLGRNQLLQGVLLRVCWDELEPKPGQFHWDILEKPAAVARKHQRQFKLLIQPGVRTPAWVYEEGAVAFDTIVADRHLSNYGEATRIPLPWDELYLRHFRRLLQAVGQRYASDPHLVAVTLTGANYLWGEMHLPRQPADLRQWESFGDYPAKILSVYQRLADWFVESFPHQQICLHITEPLHGMGPEVATLIRYGVEKYPRQWTLQSCQLDGRKDNAKIFSYRTLLEVKDAVRNGFQNVGGFKTAGERQGSIEMTVFNFVRAEAEYWEVWKADGEDEQLCERLLAELAVARKLGHEEYQKNLVRAGKYRGPDEDSYRPPGRSK